jgi:hypothetical protein
MAYKMTKEYDPKRDGPKKPMQPGAEVTMPGFPSGRPTKPGKPMKPGVSKLPAGMVNKPAMNKDMAAKKEAIRRMRGNK